MERTPHWSSRASSDTVSYSLITHGSSSSSPSSRSPLSSSLTRSVFHPKLKTWLFGKSFPLKTFSFPTGLTSRTLGPFHVFILLIGWTCLHGVLETEPALSRFSNALKINAHVANVHLMSSRTYDKEWLNAETQLITNSCRRCSSVAVFCARERADDWQPSEHRTWHLARLRGARRNTACRVGSSLSYNYSYSLDGSSIPK